MRTLPFSQNGIVSPPTCAFRPCEWTHRSPLTSNDPEAESPCYRRALYRRWRIREWLDISTGELGPVFEKPLRQRVGSLRERDADSREEGCLLGPPGKRVGCAVAGWIKARAGMSAFEFTHDQLAIAIDVRTDLQHRRFAVASGQRGQIGLRQYDRNLDRRPGEAFEPKTEPDFLRIGRGVVMVQDDVGHGRGLERDDEVSSISVANTWPASDGFGHQV